jgi:hypothetical protein
MWQWLDRVTVDTLLIRDWFLDRESIQEMLNTAGQDAWDYVHENRKKYSMRIQELIEPADFYPNPAKLRVRVKEVSQTEWNKMQEDLKAKRDEILEQKWVEHSKTIPDRPHNDLDAALNDAWNNFCNSKENLKRYTTSSKRKYVPPGARTVDPQQKKLEDHTREMENRFDEANKAVQKEDAEYWLNKRSEYMLSM